MKKEAYLISLLLVFIIGCGSKVEDVTSIEDYFLKTPTVVSVSPSNLEKNVSLKADITITATFDKNMDSKTITANTFIIKDNKGNIDGAITYSDRKANFKPNVGLTANTTYTASISKEVKDSIGNNISAEYSWSFNTGSVPISLSKTGQTTCYDSSGNVIACAGTGQDGEIQAGVAWPNPRFTVSADDYCVTDNLTGMMWVRSPDSATRTWQQSLDYANGLNLCGYTDWRLPNVNELESLINVEQPNSSAAWLNTQGFNNVKFASYWASTTNTYKTYFAWIVSMGYGYMDNNNKSVSGYFYAWPVRSGQAGVTQLWKTGQTTCYDSLGNVIVCAGTGQDGEMQAGVTWPTPRFTVSGECVTDNLTSLMWARNANLIKSINPGFDTDSTPGDGAVFWQHALDYVNGLSLCGYTDWRLPNRKELHSLDDFSRYNPSLPLDYPFLNVQSAYYWSSTSDHITGPQAAWVVGMWDKDEYMFTFYKSTVLSYVWPVRSGK